MFSVEGLCQSYGGHHVLQDISFCSESPELICIVGPNGVGKSTLIKCMDGLLGFQEGKVIIDGRDISEMSIAEVSEHIAFIPNGISGGYGMTVFESVSMGILKGRRKKLSVSETEFIYRTLEMLDILDLSERPLSELSAGQGQLVMVARGLVQDVGLILLDEPTSNLDIMHQIFVMEVLRNVVDKKGITIVCISHDLNIASRYADRVLVMAKPGIVRAFGSPFDVIDADLIRGVYSVDSEVRIEDGSPHVILKGIYHG